VTAAGEPPFDAELKERLEVIEAAACFEDRRQWSTSVLPVKRESGGGAGGCLKQVGWLEPGMGPIVLRAGAEPLMYETFEDAARDGWRPD
jgi:hypothetical protein